MKSQPSLQTSRSAITAAALSILAALLLAGSAAFSPATAGEAEPVLSRGAEIARVYKGELKAALGAGLQRGVPEAIVACRVQAPAIAESLSQQGVRIGRTSHRLRNPANTAPAWVAPILAGYLQRPDDRGPRQVSLGGSHAGYVEPITMQPVCTTCHGDGLAPDVAAKLAEHYPEDRATGFAVGDLRGVFWVEFPAVSMP